MFKKENKTKQKSEKTLSNKISYDEHFTRTSDSIDLVKNTKFIDIGDGTSKHKETEYEKVTR